NYRLCIIPITAICNNEFHFILAAQTSKVGPMVARLFTRCRALNVQYDFRPVINVFGRNIAAGFNQYFKSVITQPSNELESFSLGQRFSARNLNELAAEL